MFLLLIRIQGQDTNHIRKKVYRLNYKVEAPVMAGLFALNYLGFELIRDKPPLTLHQVQSLQKGDIWFFDRIALYQPVDQRFRARTISDWGNNVSLFLPVFLFIDREIRHDWYDIALLYFETMAINSNLYTWAGPVLVNRKRPFVYYAEIPVEEKLSKGTTDSFFSGHTSWTASASFFTAKVLSDYHPEWGAKRWLLFAAALIPPAFVGYHRIRGLKHFPTDVMVGTAVGAACGILTPHLHKIRKSDRKISFAPMTGDYTGLSVMLEF